MAGLRTAVINASMRACGSRFGRGWLRYRFADVAGLHLGEQVADYDLSHAFSGNGDK